MALRYAAVKLARGMLKWNKRAAMHDWTADIVLDFLSAHEGPQESYDQNGHNDGEGCFHCVVMNLNWVEVLEVGESKEGVG